LIYSSPWLVTNEGKKKKKKKEKKVEICGS
jgi:hypothetical protein